MTTKKKLLSFFTVLLVTSTFAQENSVIRMTESDLNSIIKVIVNAKVNRLQNVNSINEVENTIDLDSHSKNTLEVEYLNQQIESLKEQLINSQQINSNKNNPKTHDNETLYLKRDVEDLEYKIDELRRLLVSERKNTPQIIVEKTPLERHNNENPEAAKTDNLYEQKLQTQLDSLYLLIDNKPSTKVIDKTQNYSDNFSSIEKKILELQNEINTKKSKPTEYELLYKKYNTFKKQIFFANNSKAITSEQNTELLQIVDILNNNKNIDVLIKGFASSKGNPIYNQNLSLQRTESIKMALISNGVHPTRILTVYHGVDYDAKNEVEARRVDLTLIIRK